MSTNNPDLNKVSPASADGIRSFPAVHGGVRSESRAARVSKFIQRLASDAWSLLSTEVAFAKVELRAALAQAKAGVLNVSLGAGLTLMIGFVLLLGAVYLLALALPVWLAAFIVGGLAAAIGNPILNAGQANSDPASFVLEPMVDAPAHD